MDFDHRKKHNLKCHQDLPKKCKVICYNVVGLSRNPFKAAPGKSSNLSKTVTRNEGPIPDLSSNVIDVQKKYLRSQLASLWNFTQLDCN